MDSVIAMTKFPPERRPTSREPRFGPKRSFARGLVLAVPAAMVLWALALWLIS